MILNTLNDLHTEWAAYEVTNDNNADGLVLAGDIISIYMLMAEGYEEEKSRFFKFFEECSKLYKFVMFVCGNHEYWETDIIEADKFMGIYLAQFGNIYFLSNDYVEIDGTRFIGTTMWTSYTGGRDIGLIKAMNKKDNRFIKYNGEAFTPEVAAMLHDEAFEFIKSNQSDNLINVIITHHAPSYLSVSEAYLNNTDNSAYATELGDFISYSNILFWFHGHLHSTSDYMIYNTRIVCNPRGVVGQYENPGFIGLKEIIIT